MRKKKLTSKQAELIAYMLDYEYENNKYPTYREMSRQFGVTMNAIKSRLELVEKKGMVKFKRYKHRGAEVVI